MSEALTIANIRRWLDNPVVRAILNKSVKKEDGGKPVIEAALEHAVFGTGCSFTCRFYFWLIGITKRHAEIFGVDTEEAFEAHFTATEYEFRYAMFKQNYSWLRFRLRHAESWLKDPLLPPERVPKCRSIIRKFQNVCLKPAPAEFSLGSSQKYIFLKKKIYTKSNHDLEPRFGVATFARWKSNP